MTPVEAFIDMEVGIDGFRSDVGRTMPDRDHSTEPYATGVE
jgi:hypothetical protein